MRLIIAGGRAFQDYALLRERMDFFTSSIQEPIEVVSGAATGADTLGERWATERGHAIKRMPAEWDKHGKRAGYIRNAQMAEYAQADQSNGLVAFWDGSSRGTAMMIRLAEMAGIPTRVIRY